MLVLRFPIEFFHKHTIGPVVLVEQCSYQVLLEMSLIHELDYGFMSLIIAKVTSTVISLKHSLEFDVFLYTVSNLFQPLFVIFDIASYVNKNNN